MDRFVQYLPYDALGKRTLRIEQDKLVLAYKNLTRNFVDEHPFKTINQDFKYVKHGDNEWDGVLTGLIIAAIVLVLFTKTLHSLVLRTVFLSIQIIMLFAAVYLLALKFFKREYCYILDVSGETIVAIRMTPKSKIFISRLQTMISGSKAV